MPVEVRPLTGADLARVLPDVARLRMRVFRDWPYLYDGDFDYEHRYLQSYRDSAGAVIVGAFDGDRIVGAATGTPLRDHAEEFATAFAEHPVPLDAIFYNAESVLLPEYRGQGIGHRFFDLREDHARGFGFTHATFCAVQRPDDHPARPKGARDLAPFWRARGYEFLPTVTTHFAWRDVGDVSETRKPMHFWMRKL